MFVSAWVWNVVGRLGIQLFENAPWVRGENVSLGS